mgnify:CR=1 FL=1
MIRPGQIIASGLRCIVAEENRAGMPDLRQQLERFRNGQFEMFRSDPVAELCRFKEVTGNDDRPVVFNRLAGDGCASQ